ncbi:SH3 domain-containing protein [Sphingomonadaceae bacterium]|nr:SH3 domain-containing protein [Sphingomonadaceae bacterium]
MGKFLSILFAVSLLWIAPASAQQREVPYWASLDAEEVNMRVGPSRDFKIEWVYKREGMPVKVIRVVEGWRRVREPDGTEGWMAASLLRLAPTAMIIGETPTPMRDSPAQNGGLKWNAEPGVVGRLGVCEAGWCQFDVGGRAGWVEESRLWGAGEP